MIRKNQPHRVKSRREKTLAALRIRISVARATLEQAQADPTSDLHRLIISAMPRKITEYEAARGVLEAKLKEVT